MTLCKLVMVAVVVLVMSSGAARAADGAALYKSRCASCHGDTGDADSPMAKAMKVPALAGNATVSGMADADLIAKIKGIKQHAGAKSLTDADFSAVATYVKQLAAAK